MVALSAVTTRSATIAMMARTAMVAHPAAEPEGVLCFYFFDNCSQQQVVPMDMAALMLKLEILPNIQIYDLFKPLMKIDADLVARL